MKSMDFIPRILTRNNIELAISDYKKKLKEIPLTIEAYDLLGLMNILKRQKIGKGPYPNVTIFESANRIMTDLVLLNGVKMLFSGVIKEINFSEYNVEYGNENNNEHDITATENGKKLKCEVFNVAESFFQTKKAKSLKKLREYKKDEDILLIMFNKDAAPEKYNPKRIENEYYLLVDIEEI